MLANFGIKILKDDGHLSTPIDVCNSDKILKHDGHPPSPIVHALRCVIRNLSQKISP